MNCPKCGSKLGVKQSHAIPKGVVRRSYCPECLEDVYSTELIQDNGNFFAAVNKRYQKAWRDARVKARRAARAERVKEREANEQRTPEKLSSN